MRERLEQDAWKRPGDADWVLKGGRKGEEEEKEREREKEEGGGGEEGGRWIRLSQYLRYAVLVKTHGSYLHYCACW